MLESTHENRAAEMRDATCPVLVRGLCHTLCAPLPGRTVARKCPDTQRFSG